MDQNGPGYEWSTLDTNIQWLLDVERNMYAIVLCLLIEYTNVIVHLLIEYTNVIVHI